MTPSNADRRPRRERLPAAIRAKATSTDGASLRGRSRARGCDAIHAGASMNAETLHPPVIGHPNGISRSLHHVKIASYPIPSPSGPTGTRKSANAPMPSC